MQKQKTTNNKLKAWLLTRPIGFALLAFAFMIIFSIFGSVLDAILSMSDETAKITMIIMVAISFIYPAYRLIKKLPHDNMYQHDFIAITNGALIISVLASVISFSVVALYGQNLQRDAMIFYLLNPTASTFIFLGLVLFTLYLIGVALSGLYAKYKRCKQIGLSTWKIILSMPFGFLLLWTPGYLIQDKTTKSVVQIKSKWYSRLNKWVVSDFSNTLFMFLFLLFCKNVISGMPTVILSASLLLLYTLWYVKHKSDFIKNINNGYATTAVGINIAILIAILIQHI